MAVIHLGPVSHRRRGVHKLPTIQIVKKGFVEFELENSKSAKEVSLNSFCDVQKDLGLPQCNEGLVNTGEVLRRGLLLQVAFACGKSAEFLSYIRFHLNMYMNQRGTYD